VSDCRAEVGLLTSDVEQLTRLPGAGAEVPVVEQEHAHAGGAEAIGVGVEPLLAGGREPVRHDHDRVGALAVRPVGPRGALDAVCAEHHVGSLHQARAVPPPGIVSGDVGVVPGGAGVVPGPGAVGCPGPLLGVPLSPG
jgi:hypothetical protein